MCGVRSAYRRTAVRARAWMLCVAALPACGDNLLSLDAAAPVACSATFSGDFSEASRGGSDCATVSSTGELALAIYSTTLQSTLAIQIELGPTPAPGEYAPELTPAWSALVTSSVNSGCIYSAGSTAVPTGSFVLSLDAVAPAVHGTLALDAYVHALVLTTCGAQPTEHLAVVF
jgi:hypothetical protein